MYIYVCLFEGRKKRREIAFMKINFSLSKTKMDLCAVIYGKWLEAGRREWLVSFQRSLVPQRMGHLQTYLAAPRIFLLNSPNGQGPKPSKQLCESKTLNFVKISDWPLTWLSVRLLHSQEFRTVTHNRHPQEISKQGNTPGAFYCLWPRWKQACEKGGCMSYSNCHGVTLGLKIAHP